jgi:hypothetical protein
MRDSANALIQIDHYVLKTTCFQLESSDNVRIHPLFYLKNKLNYICIYLQISK